MSDPVPAAPSAPAGASVAVDAALNLPALVRAAGGDPAMMLYVADRLHVPGVAQADLDAALAAYDPSVDLKARLVAYANARQWARATGGFMVTIAGAPIAFATTESALGLMGDKVLRLAQPNAPASINWQVGETAFVTITADDFVHAATKVSDFVQATFDALPALFAGIAAGAITSTAAIDAAAWPAASAALS